MRTGSSFQQSKRIVVHEIAHANGARIQEPIADPDERRRWIFGSQSLKSLRLSAIIRGTAMVVARKVIVLSVVLIGATAGCGRSARQANTSLPAIQAVDTPTVVISGAPDTVAVVHGAFDTAAVKRAISVKYGVSENSLPHSATFRGDTAWALVQVHPPADYLIRVERRSGRWVFVRVDAIGIR